MNEFDQAVITGSFQRYGKAATTRKHGLMINDFVMIVYETQSLRRYGIVTEVLSSHNVRVKILHKRSIGKKQTHTPKVETFSASQVKLIYRSSDNKDT